MQDCTYVSSAQSFRLRSLDSWPATVNGQTARDSTNLPYPVLIGWRRGGQDAKVIIQVGFLEPIRGHIFHLEGLGRLRDVPGWICWQVGGVQRSHETQYLEQMKNAAVRLGIADRIRFLGWQPDVRRLMAA